MTGMSSSTDAPQAPKPLELKEYLDQYVSVRMPQKEAGRRVYNHYKRIQMNKQRTGEVELSKSNILLIGPTGTVRRYWPKH